MKRALFLCLFLGFACAWASAQNGKVITPHTLNPEAAVVDSLQAGVGATAVKKSSNRWYFGLGGGLDYSSNYGWYVGIAPDVSYKVSNALFVGGQVSYRYYQGESLAGICPYLRWHVVPLGKAVSVFVTAYAPCDFWADYLHLGARVKPGLAIRLSEGFYAMGSFGSFGYSYYRSGGVPTEGWVANLGSDTVSVGVLFCL